MLIQCSAQYFDLICAGCWEICAGCHCVICSDCWAKMLSSGQAHLAPPTEATMLLDILQSENEITVYFVPSFDTMI